MTRWSSSDDLNEIMDLDPWIVIMIMDAVMWAQPRGLFVRITSMMRESNDGISQSTTHQEGRAADLSVQGWSKIHIEELAKYLNDKYASKIGTSPEGKPKLACVYHNNGNGWHFHLQVRRTYRASVSIS